MSLSEVDRLRARNEELESLVAHYKRELGILQAIDKLAALRRAGGLTNVEGMALLALHARFPGTVTKNAMMDALYERSADEPLAKIVDVYICKLRRKLGSGAIETIHGRGHALTATGHAFVQRALSASGAAA